jgi:hypothetical protein
VEAFSLSVFALPVPTVSRVSLMLLITVFSAFFSFVLVVPPLAYSIS